MEFTGDGFFGFDDVEQVKKQLRHMLRTEQGQKGTNERMVENIVLLTVNPEAEEYFQFPEDLEARKEYEDIYAGFCKEVTYESLVAGRFDWKDDEAFSFTDEMVHKAFDLIKKAEEQVGTVILAVAHLDKPDHYIHVHLLADAYDR